MEFKKMDENDVAQVARLQNELAYFLKEKTKDDYFNFENLSQALTEKNLKESLEKAEAVTFVAKDADKVVAFISGEIKDNFLATSKIKKIGHISGAYVMPEYRRQGIMQKLENTILEFFKKQGLAYAELHVITNNLLGKDNWKALGYKTFREQMRKKI